MMIKTNLALTIPLHCCLSELAADCSIAETVERLLWDSPEVKRVAKTMKINQIPRRQRGQRGKDKSPRK